MIEQLFGSKTRVKLLKLFYSNPNRSFYVREMTRLIDEQINSVRRELANLLSIGVITSDSAQHKLYYEVDQKFEHYEALLAMFAEGVTKPKTKKKVKKSDKTEDEPAEATFEAPKTELPEAKKWKGIGNVSGIAYSGAYTRDDSANADILVVGDVNDASVEAVVAKLEKEKNRELRYAVIALDEWRYRSQVRDKFWTQFMSAKKQVVLDVAGVFNKEQ